MISGDGAQKLLAAMQTLSDELDVYLTFNQHGEVVFTDQKRHYVFVPTADNPGRLAIAYPMAV
jgi:hypothetical protein